MSEIVLSEMVTKPSSPAAGRWKVYVKEDGIYTMDDTGTEFGPLGSGGGSSASQKPFQARLTLASGTPVPTNDVTGATTLYLTPYMGNTISLYSGSSWKDFTLTETGISLSGTSANTNYDVFVYDNNGSPGLELVAWENNTGRAVALGIQDGVYVKSGVPSRRYVGTIRITSSGGQCENSKTRRFVWNFYNRKRMQLFVAEATDSWTYGAASWRPANNSTANRVEFVLGLSEEPIDAEVAGCFGCPNTNAYILFGLALDATNTSHTVSDGVTYLSSTGAANQILPTWARFSKYVAPGYHYLQWVEYAINYTCTVYSKSSLRQSGIVGEISG